MKMNLLVKSLMVTLGFLFFLLPSTQASQGSIHLVMDGSNFYISARCYTQGGDDNVGPWVTNMSLTSTHRCGSSSNGAQYIKIQRKSLWFQNKGSAWRVHRPASCSSLKAFCVKVSGTSLGEAGYDTQCGGNCKSALFGRRSDDGESDDYLQKVIGDIQNTLGQLAKVFHTASDPEQKTIVAQVQEMQTALLEDRIEDALVIKENIDEMISSLE